jgi:Alpha-glutamyl/putrescinyl thymine pyrophosphorylase clade 3
MINPVHRNRRLEIHESLARYEAACGALPGIDDQLCRETLVAQIISSLRRIEFIRSLVSKNIDQRRLDPASSLFDPLQGALILSRHGKSDEAIWLAFIGTHFGKHLKDGWKLSALVYGSFGQGPVWTAKLYGDNPQKFEKMLNANRARLIDPKQSGRFSNHRRYQSKKPEAIARVFQSFHAWQHQEGGFVAKVRAIHQQSGQQPTETFDALYRSMRDVYGFGRLGNFDFLTMIGKLHLAPIEPGSVYLQGATGPLAGAKLLFHGDRAFSVGVKALGNRVDGLDPYLNVGKQVLEDSLCNWQKSPHRYLYFKG